MQSSNASTPPLGPSPSAKNLGYLQKCGEQRAAASSKFQELSSSVLDTLTSTRNVVVLHIQPENFPDHLLRLHTLLQTTGSLRVYSLNERRDIPLGVIVVVDSLNPNYSGFKQARWVSSERLNQKGTEAFDGAAYRYTKDCNVVVMKGLTLNDQGRFQDAINRLGRAVKNVMKETGARGFVWHECATIELLARTLQGIENGKEGNIHLKIFKAICCTSGFSSSNQGFATKFGFQNEGPRNALLNYLAKSKIPLLFLDSSTLGLPPTSLQTKQRNNSRAWNPVASHLPHFAVQYSRLLPLSSYRPLLARGLDQLATTVFQLRVATLQNGISEKSAVEKVTRALGLNDKATILVKPWAKKCINVASYTSSALMDLRQQAGTALWQSFLLSTCPIEFRLDALIGGIVDPGTNLESSPLRALRVDINFTSPSICVHTDSKIATYMLVSTAHSNPHSFTAQHLNNSWEKITSTLLNPNNSALKIPTEIAASWEHLALEMMKNLQEFGKSEAYKNFGENGKQLFSWWVGALWSGAMSSICANSLGRHPMAPLAKKK